MNRGNMEQKEILVLHGWMHSAARYRRFKKLMEAGEENLNLTLYEFPGFGNTKGRPGRGLLNCYARDLALYLKEHNTDAVIAHSMGGAVLIRAVSSVELAKRPKIILINPAYHGIRKLLPAAFFFPVIWGVLALMKELPFCLSGPFYRTAALLTINRRDQIDDLILQDSRRADPLTAALLLGELALDRFRTHADLGQVYLIVSGKDRVISQRSVRLLEKDLKHVTRIDFPGIGHTPVVEAFSDLADCIRELLDFTF